MSERVGYARCSLDRQDLTAQRDKTLFDVLATFAEFEVDLPRMRTGEGTAVAPAKGKRKGEQPELTARRQSHPVQQRHPGEYTIAGLAELFFVSRTTVHRVLERHQSAAAVPSASGGQ